MRNNIFKTLLTLLAIGISSTAFAYSNSDLHAVLNGASCPGGDLSGADLSGMDLSGRDFTNTDFFHFCFQLFDKSFSGSRCGITAV